jgi:hypothetical protein
VVDTEAFVLKVINSLPGNISFAAKVVSLSADPYTHQLQAVDSNPAIHLFLKNAIFLALFLLGARYLKTDRERLYLKLYLVSCVIVAVLFNFDAVIAMRLSIYFAIFEIFLLAFFTRAITNAPIRQIYNVVLFFLCLHAIWASVYSTNPLIFAPYKGVFINQDVTRNLGWF